MASKRQMQISALIQRNFSEVLREEGYYIYGNALVTVTRVEVSPDLSLSSIYVSVFNVEDNNTVLDQLNEHLWKLKKGLAKRIRNKVRRIPQLRLFLDDTLDEMSRIDQLLAKYKKDSSPQ